MNRSAELRPAAQTRLVQALSGSAVSPPPVWLMRQAGRYLPEFRALRSRSGSFLDLCDDPDGATEATLQPLRRFPLDAAILFSDILVIPRALGVPLSFVEGTGPVLEPVHTSGEITNLPETVDRALLEPAYSALRQLRDTLSPETALIGFAGAPWTLACYMVEGGVSRDFRTVRALAYGRPRFFETLISRLTRAVGEHLVAQVDAGANVVQVFDSHAGVLDSEGLHAWSVRPLRDIVNHVRKHHPAVPVIVFPRGAGASYEAYTSFPGGSALAIDQHVHPLWAARHLQTRLPVQGNLDPARLVEGKDTLRRGVKDILDAFRGQPFVFNLGHGVLPDTPPEHVALLVDQVKGSSA